MEGRIVVAIGGCAVLAGLAYILQGGKRREENRKQSGTVPGLVNLGNTCYLNSVLQALASVSAFVSWINICSERNKSRQKLTSELSKFVQILNKPCYEQESHDPTSVFQCLYSHGWVISLEQQDAHEIFQVLTSTLADEQDLAGSQKNWNSLVINEESMGIQDESIVLRSGVTASKVKRKSMSPFVGLFANQLSCKACSNKYPVKFDSFDTISLSLSSNFQLGRYSLEALIRNFMCSEVLESFECTGCATKDGGKRRLLKKLSIGKPPKSLCFHINRTYWQNNGVPYKNNAFVKFPKTLDIQPFLYTPNKVSPEIPRIIRTVDTRCSSKDSCSIAPSTVETNTMKTTASQIRVRLNTEYSLAAVIVHLGGVENGHYVTYKKPQWQKTDEWYLVSDEITRTVPVSRVLNSTAYMLFYQRTTQ